MTTQTIFYADPCDAAITGFIFTDLDTYNGEFDHRHALFGADEYELQIIRGSQIDQELFAGLKFNHSNLTVWFDEIQHLTFDEKVGLWFLVGCCGYQLELALDVLQDGLSIFHGTKEELIDMSNWQSTYATSNLAPFLQEFQFADETWVGNPAIY